MFVRVLTQINSKKMKKILLLLSVILFSTSIFAQNNLTKTNKNEKFTKFSTKKPDKYGEDLIKYFEKTNIESVQATITDFVSAYNSYPLDKKKQIIKTSNFFIKKRASKSSHFVHYFEIVMLMNESGRDPNNYTVLEEMIEKTLIKEHQSIKSVDDLIKSLIFLHKKGIMYSNRGIINWKTSATDFKLILNKTLTIEYANTDLICNDPHDSLMILNTSGTFIINKHLWKGKGGKVSWEKTGLPLNEVYAEIDDYTIDLNKREYKVKSANFTYSKYSLDTIKGSFHDKLQNVSKKEKKNFPRFEAFEYVTIENVVENVNYEGPFTMKGAKFLGTNAKKDYGHIEILKDDTLRVMADSRAFTFKDEDIRGNDTKIKILIEDKDINHPGVLFRYKIDTLKNNARKVEMTRIDKGMGQSPFFNTFHNLEMDVEQVLWYIDSSKIEMNNLVGAVSASGKFKTLDNFDIVEYRKMQLSDKQHPLVTIKKYEERYKTRGKIDLKGMVRYTKREKHTVNQMLMRMAYKGFITYDVKTEEGIILPRLYNYLKFKSGKGDFDILSVDSKIDSSRAARKTSKIASLDLKSKNKGLSIKNVSEVPLSSIHNVVCIPDSGEIVMEKDRNFTFSGTLKTEFLEFYGSGFAFNFDSFKFDLKNIDFLKIFIRGDTLPNLSVIDRDQDFFYPEGKGRGQGIPKEEVYKVLDENLESTDTLIRKEVVKSRIENITGYLRIDSTVNRSGIEKFHQFPIFTCTDTALVYYDKYYEEVDGISIEEKILDGKYDREKFYFQINPFTVDSLGDFTANSWDSPGTFHSSIFPDFKENLKIQIDTILDEFANLDDSINYQTIYSLGFIRPDSVTYDVYKDVGEVQGVAYNSIKLSNKGLHGVGNLKYLTATIESSDFVYFPDFMVTDAFNVIVEESNDGTEYAESLGESNFVEWLPSKDSLIISSGLKLDNEDIINDNWDIYKTTKLNIDQNRKPIEMYDGQAILTGQSIITPSEHIGWGTMEFENSELTSSKFVFKMNMYDADTADFLIKPTGFLIPAFEAYNVNSHIDYSESKGLFKSNGSSSKALFPVNEFMTYMDQFEWDIDKNEIEVGVALSTDSTRSGSEYVSTHRQQDSLRFMSYSSGYSLEDYILRCYEVDSINVSNGTIFPDSTIIIKPKAEIDPLYNTVLKADNTNRFHIITDATIKILGRNEIKGMGTYDYVYVEKNEYGEDTTIIYKIKFDAVTAVRKDSIIRAYGKIEENKNNKIKLNLSEQFVNFIGNVELFTNEKMLRFKGVVSLNNDKCTALQTESIQFEGKIDPDSTVLEYTSEPTNASGSKITSGFFSTKDTIYTAFLSKSKSYLDVPFFADSGVLYYNKRNSEYIISSKEKYQNPDTIGNILAFNNKYCYMTAIGDLNLDAKLGQVKLKTIGNAKHNFATNEISLNTFLSIDFFFNEKASELIADKVFESASLVGIDVGSDTYQRALEDLLGVRAAEKLNAELERSGEFKRVPQQLNNLFTFSEVYFKWDTISLSYKSEGKLNLAIMNDRQLNKAVSGYIEIIKKNTGDEINILIEPNGADWYFFQYVGGTMFAISGDSEFNKLMREGKENERENKVENEPDFKYRVGDADARKIFIEKMTGVTATEEEEELETDQENTPVIDEDDDFDGGE